jgi:hypothetical protein
MERFFLRVNKTETCWLWMGALHPNGHGLFAANNSSRRSVWAHKFIFERMFGTIEVGFDIHHKCENKVCVNPEHLEKLPHGVHTKLRFEKQTHCKNGHEFTEENTYLRIRRVSHKIYTMRVCRSCDKHRGVIKNLEEIKR